MYVLWIAFSLCQIAYSQQVEIQAYQRDGSIYVDAFFSYDDTEEIFRSLGDGLKSEIIFEFRLYEKNEGFFSFFGDRLLLEKRPSYTAYFDVYEDAYVVVETDGTYRQFDNKQTFIDNFFSISDFMLAEDLKNILRHYILARIRLIPIKLIPPLTVIALFAETGNISSSWEEGYIR